MTNLNQQQASMFRSLQDQLKILDNSFYDVMNELNGLKDTFKLMENFLTSKDQSFARLESF